MSSVCLSVFVREHTTVSRRSVCVRRGEPIDTGGGRAAVAGGSAKGSACGIRCLWGARHRHQRPLVSGCVVVSSTTAILLFIPVSLWLHGTRPVRRLSYNSNRQTHTYTRALAFSTRTHQGWLPSSSEQVYQLHHHPRWRRPKATDSSMA